MQTKKIQAKELKTWLDEKKDFVLVDIMNPEYFEEKHIAGAINAPVYEVAFLTYLEKLKIPKDKNIVVYDEVGDSLAVADAELKLARSGFKNVQDLVGGLSQWEQLGYSVEKGVAVPVAEIVDGKYSIDKEKSIVGWTGRNAKYAHHGKIAVRSGDIVVQDKKISSGQIVLDMTTIKDEDLTDDMWRGILESHLKSSDFFDVENFPEASFEFSSVEKIEAAHIGTPNVNITGTLTIKGVANPIIFPAMIVPMEDGTLNGQAHFDFDRTLWNVRYGSEKFFQKLGMHLVNDIVSLELFLVAKLVK